jgi:hypothetical protein
VTPAGSHGALERSGDIDDRQNERRATDHECCDSQQHEEGTPVRGEGCAHSHHAAKPRPPRTRVLRHAACYTASSLGAPRTMPSRSNPRCGDGPLFGDDCRFSGHDDGPAGFVIQWQR